MSRHIVEIENQLKAEGYVPGSDQYKKLFLERKVQTCQELRGVPSCYECLVNDNCNLFTEYLVTIRLP